MTGIPPRLPMPSMPWDEHPEPEYLQILEAYRAELGIDETRLPTTTNAIVEALHWWNTGAPELADEPTPAGKALAALDAYTAAGDPGGPHTQEYRAVLEQADRLTRVGMAGRDPAWPDRPRPPRSRYAPEVRADGDY